MSKFKIRAKRGNISPSSFPAPAPKKFREIAAQYAGYTKKLARFFPEEDFEDETLEFPVELKPGRSSGKTFRWKETRAVVQQDKILFEQIMQELNITIIEVGDSFQELRAIIDSNPILKVHIGLAFNEEVVNLQQYFLARADELHTKRYQVIIKHKVSKLWLAY